MRSVAPHLGEKRVAAYVDPGGDVGGIRYGVLRVEHDAVQRYTRLKKLLGFSCVDQTVHGLRVNGKFRFGLCNLKRPCGIELVIASAHALDCDRRGAWIGVAAVGEHIISILTKSFTAHSYGHTGP